MGGGGTEGEHAGGSERVRQREGTGKLTGCLGLESEREAGSG